jgi:hypothetical protein
MTDHKAARKRFSPPTAADHKDEAARAMLAALQTTRLQLHVALAGKQALSIEKQLSIVDAAIVQAEAAGITAEG